MSCTGISVTDLWSGAKRNGKARDPTAADTTHFLEATFGADPAAMAAAVGSMFES